MHAPATVSPVPYCHRPASARPGSASHKAAAPAAESRAAAPAGSADRELQRRIANLEEELSVAKQKDEDTAQERDFYFSKLREIELLCQREGVKERWDIMQAVENILYAATEEEGTQAREAAQAPLACENGADNVSGM